MIRLRVEPTWRFTSSNRGAGRTGNRPCVSPCPSAMGDCELVAPFVALTLPVRAHILVVVDDFGRRLGLRFLASHAVPSPFIDAVLVGGPRDTALCLVSRMVVQKRDNGPDRKEADDAL